MVIKLNENEKFIYNDNYLFYYRILKKLLTCLKSAKWLPIFDLLKISKRNVNFLTCSKSVNNHLRSSYQCSTKSKKKNVCLQYKMIILSLNQLKLVAESRGMKDYENKSEDELIKILSEPRPKISLSKRE